jgi:hypothetical protein
MYTAAEAKAFEAQQQDKRYQQRVVAAVRAFRQYLSFGGFAQCAADRLRLWNARNSIHSNMADNRRCPRCYALGHTLVGPCPLRGIFNDSPEVHATLAGQDYVSAQTGLRFDARQTPWCTKCRLWGHRAEDCVKCTLCMRWGHVVSDCASGLLPDRQVPPGEQPPQQ